MNALPTRRRAGLLVPLFSMPSTTSWGIGDIADLAPVSAWLAAAGQSVLQLLPINEMAPAQQSPYSAISAMAIDPIFISLPAVEDWTALGGEGCLSADDRASLDEVRRARDVRYDTVRRLKQKALSAAFDRFYEHEWKRGTDRAASLKTFADAEAWWLDDYAVFRTIRDREQGRPWTEWPTLLQQRAADMLGYVHRTFQRDVLFFQYLQWLAGAQWHRARATAASHGVALFGDLPFMVDADSADVWAHQSCFHLDITVGAPPDAFSETGQDWGMPLYNWEGMAADDFRWLKHRAQRSADLYDGYRVDHLVGFYRTYGRPRDGEPFFTPAKESEQVLLGERVLSTFKEPGAEIIAEDLGIVPDYVRESLRQLEVPGFCILRWERWWHRAGQPFRDPSEYPVLSVAASGTHDTEPLMTWWSSATDEDRKPLNELTTVLEVTEGRGLCDRSPADVRDALIQALYASASGLVLLPVQDAFGWCDRINVPATITPENWTFRLPWPTDRLDDVPEARDCQARLSAWTAKYSRR